MKVKTAPTVAFPSGVLGKSIPEDYPWKILGWLTEDLSQYLSIEELKAISTVTRNRDIEGYLQLAQGWSLQSTPPQILSHENFMAKYQLAALLKKFQFPTDNEARKLAAIEKFLAGEAQCKRFNTEGYTSLSVAKEEWMVDVFTYAQSFCQKVLGFDVPDLNVMTDRSRHGPGATTGTDRGCVSSYFKFEKWPYHCTERALGIARELITSDERWLGALEDDYRRRNDIPMHVIINQKRFWTDVFEVVKGNRITFVPKSAKIDRSIAIEPTLNLYLQLGVDGYIRRRLKRWGVDLDSQEKNKELARLGSVNNSFTTLDLANASNTISLKLCKLLLPQDWYDLLIKLRSPEGDLGGQVIHYEMMSSMGNGFTFALESLLFTAIVYAVSKVRLGKFHRDACAIFGDDIIVPTEIAQDVVVALTNCGFRINEDKSFFEGPIRESCGADWYRGRTIRPIFLSSRPEVVDELLCDYNRIKRVLYLRFGIEEGKVLTGIFRWIPEFFRKFKGPYSDQEFSSYIHWACPVQPYQRWVYKFRRLVRKPIRKAAKKLHFRKLMHDLHPAPCPVSIWESKGRRLSCSGGRFNVSIRGMDMLSAKVSVASYWQSEYTETLPAWHAKPEG